MRGILVVDDDEAVRRFVSGMLAAAGYSVFQAGGGSEALATLSQHSHGIGLLLTDICMPELDGAELGRRVREDYSDVSIIYMTGFSGQSLEPGAMVLYKPFTADAVRKAVAAAMKPG